MQKFKVPQLVRLTARRALLWRRRFGRGGTEVGLNTATILANNEYVTLEKILHISKYFPRHEVDKRGKDFFNEDKPSKGRIAWDLWGGDVGRDWSNEIKKMQV
jgi:hypothetical protein